MFLIEVRLNFLIEELIKHNDILTAREKPDHDEKRRASR